MNTLTKAIVAATLFFSSTVSAQEMEVERILIPLSTRGLQGGYGTRWSTRLAVSNVGPKLIDVQAPILCSFECQKVWTAQPYWNDLMQLESPPDTRPAHVIVVPKSAAGDLQFLLTLHRSGASGGQPATTLAASVPVVRESEMHSGPFRIPLVPWEAARRYRLRLYALEGEPTATIRVLTGSHGTNEIWVTTLSLAPGVHPFLAPFAEIALDPMIVANGELVTIEVVPGPGAQNLWALLTATDNITQEVITFAAE